MFEDMPNWATELLNIIKDKAEAKKLQQDLQNAETDSP